MRHPDHTPEPNQHNRTPSEFSAEPTSSARPHRATSELWEVEQVETTAMTPEQYETAVSTLATLIAEWLRNTRPEIDDQAA